MSDIMKGVGLAHTLAEAFENSEASFGRGRHWTDKHIDALTTKEGKLNILGPMLDVLRGDAEIVPRKRIIYSDSVKPGDKDEYSRSDCSVVVFNRTRVGNTRIPNRLVLGEFRLGVASRETTIFYEHNQDGVESGRIKPKQETHIDVPDDDDLLQLSRRYLLPKFLIGKKLPGIALRNFYLENPHHRPECFSRIVLFWGTICKNDWCYYVPAINGTSEYGIRICTYEVVGGKDVIGDFGALNNVYDAAVFI